MSEDWWKELSNTTDAPTEAPPTASDQIDRPTIQQETSDNSQIPSVNWWEQTRGQELRAAPQHPRSNAAAPPLGYLDRNDLAAPNFVIARASLAPDVKDQIRRYAEYFKQPESHFGVMDGNIVRWVQEENAFATVVPTMGRQAGFVDTLRAGVSQTAAAFGPTAPQLAATAAGIITGPTGTSIPITAATAFATDWARQALDKLLAGEDMVPLAGAEYDYINSLGHAALAAGGQAVGVGINKLLSHNPMGIEAFERQRVLDAAERAKWAAIDAEAKKRGITLSTGQRTGLRSLMAKERQLMRYPETADMVSEFRDVQRQTQIPSAYMDEITSLHPVTGREAMIGSFREAADDVVRQAQNVRAVQAKEAYGLAYKAHPSLDSPVLRNLFDREVMKTAIDNARKIANAKGKLMGPIDAELGMYAREAAARGQIPYPKGGVASGLSLETWDQIKYGLDDVISQHIDKAGKLDKYGQAILSLKKELTNELDRLTGGVGNADSLYKKARLLYGESSEAIDQILDGGIGVLQRIKGPERVGIVSRVFSGKDILPEEITRMRDLFIKNGYVKEWNAGLAAHLSQLLDDSQKAAGMSGNLPGQIYSRLGRNRLQHDTVIAAMGPDKARGFEKFLDVMYSASRSLPEGSPTATDQLMSVGAVGRKARAVGKVLSPSSWFDIGNQIVEGIDSLRTPAARIKLAEYLLTDKGAKEITKFKDVSRVTQEAITMAARVMTNAGVVASGIRTPADFPPPMLTEGKGNK